VHARIRRVRIGVGKVLAATLLTLCLGVQALEATGSWDRTFQDTGDEAAIVSVVLCIGAALAVACAARPRASLSAIQSPIVVFDAAASPPKAPVTACAASRTSPHLGLRI
jgi:hypothetical protein